MTAGVTGHASKSPPSLAEEVAPHVAELAAEGHGRNAIAKALAVSEGTVSNAARIAGVTFDRGPTEVATRTRAEQLAEDRADLAAMSAEIARRAGRQLYMELGAEVLDPNTLTVLNRVFGTATDKALAAGVLIPTDDKADNHGFEVWVDGLKAQLSAFDLGIIRPDENGNFPLVMNAEHVPREAAELDPDAIEEWNPD